MIVYTELAGLLGPFDRVEVLADRLLCDGAEVPFSVIGAFEQLEVELPFGFNPEQYEWKEGALAPKVLTDPSQPSLLARLFSFSKS
ncbi:hypothetical protein [Duganella sp.]|uniref:hypothetical protein n=1 Tax=Duganella sp. TaxID=1904440 RepID=UPI0031DE8493